MLLLIQLIFAYWIARAIPLCLRLALFLYWRWSINNRTHQDYYYCLEIEGHGIYPKRDGLTRHVRYTLGSAMHNQPLGVQIMGPWWFITPENFKKKILSL